MMEANGFQIDGDHYKKNKYEHWDFVIDTKMHYLLGCATKYIFRWRDKNGTIDLRKALHYISKAEENDISFPMNINLKYITRFLITAHPNDKLVLKHIINNNFKSAIICINHIIYNLELKEEPDSSYTNQDKHMENVQ